MKRKLLELSELVEQIGTVLRAYAIFGTVPTLSQLISGVRVLREQKGQTQQ